MVVFSASTSSSSTSSAEDASKSHQSLTPPQFAHSLLDGDDTNISHTILKAIDLEGCKLCGTSISVTELTCTVKFLAPEVARALVLVRTCGDSPVTSQIIVDPKMDSWSLGVTLFQLIHPTFQTLDLTSACTAEDGVTGEGGHSLKLADWTLTQLATSDLDALQAVVDSCIDVIAAHAETMSTSLIPQPSISEPSMLGDEQISTTTSDKTLAADIVHLVPLIRSLLRVNPEERATISEAMNRFWKEKKMVNK